MYHLVWIKQIHYYSHSQNPRRNLGNITTNGNQPGYQSFKNDIYYQVKTGGILNPIPISNVGVKINNILYDNDQGA